MATFKAKLSPKQMFTYKGSSFKASNYLFITDNEEVIELLSKNPYWTSEGESKPKKAKEDKKSKKSSDSSKGEE